MVTGIVLSTIAPPALAATETQGNDEQSSQITKNTSDQTVEFQVANNQNQVLPTGAYAESKFAPAVGVYFIPGIGEVALAATGAVIIGGITYEVGTRIWKRVHSWLRHSHKVSVHKSRVSDKVPARLKKKNGDVDLGKFTKRVKGRRNISYEEKRGWRIEKDRAGKDGHGGSYWKLKNKKGDRIATLDEKGKILRK